MQTNLAPKRETPIPADAWASSIGALDRPAGGGGIVRDELSRMMADYLASGGQIQQVAQGATSAPHDAPRPAPPGIGNLFTPAERLAHEARNAARKTPAAVVDAPYVAAIRQHLGAAVSGRDLSKLCGVSSCKLQRLLRTYFADDATAAPLISASRYERDAVREQFPALIEKMSFNECAAVLEMHPERLRRLVDVAPVALKKGRK